MGEASTKILILFFKLIIQWKHYIWGLYSFTYAHFERILLEIKRIDSTKTEAWGEALSS